MFLIKMSTVIDDFFFYKSNSSHRRSCLVLLCPQVVMFSPFVPHVVMLSPLVPQVVNYPEPDVNWTRISEYKHAPNQPAGTKDYPGTVIYRYH